MTCEPTIPTMPKFTTGSLGLLTRAINMSRTVNSKGLGPDEFNNMSFDNNMDTWWLALPTALYSAITPETELPTTLRGNTMCPRWDELIMSPTPSTAICNMFYHATELHIESNNWQQAKLLALCTNSAQQKRRIGNGTINLFNRGYFMETQMQVEAGHFLNLTTDEFSTVQLWSITANTTGGNILQKIANATSWQQHTCAHSTGDWTSTWMAPGPHQRLGVHRNASTQQDANTGSTAFEPGLGEPTSSPTRHSTSILGGQDIRAFSWQPNDPGICQCQHQHGSVQH